MMCLKLPRRDFQFCQVGECITEGEMKKKTEAIINFRENKTVFNEET